MTARDDLDRHLAAWLTADAPTSEPEHLLGEVLARTARTRRRPAWRIPERWIPMSVATSRVATSPRVPWRTVGLVALLVIALVAAAVLLVGSRSRPLPPPFGPADNGRIVYAESGELWSRATLTATPTRIMDGPDKIAAFFAPDGARVAILQAAGAAGSDLWVANPDGSDARRLGGPYLHDDWYEWSPDGSLIAVQSDIDGQPRITLVRTDGTGATVLNLGMPAQAPTFRPTDGHQLLVRGQVPTDFGLQWGFYLVGLDGSNPVHLDLAPGFSDQPSFNENRDFYFLNPAWSPDGTRLAFHTLESSTTDPDFRIHIAEIGPTGAVSGERTLDFDHTASDEFAAQWLPTGDGLVYQSSVNDKGPFQVRTGSLVQGAVPHDLTALGDHDFGIGIAPDGTQVMVRPNDPASTSVQVVDIATGRAADTTFHAGDLPGWQRLARTGGSGR
jgi:Tol biopolymer transport system component